MAANIRSVKVSKWRLVVRSDLEDFIRNLSREQVLVKLVRGSGQVGRSILGPKGRAHRVGGSLTIRIENMAVNIGGHSDRGVTEHLADHLELHPLCEHETRR